MIEHPFREAEHKSGMAATLKLLEKDPVFKKIERTTLKEWIKLSEKDPSMAETRGRKVNHAFDKAVLSRLIYVSTTTPDGESGTASMRVEANAMFSYDIIKTEAIRVQKEKPWAEMDEVQKLTFSPPWISSFLARNSFKRRRITTVHKKLPSQEEVRKEMDSIAQAQRDFNIGSRWVVNLDESAIFYGMAPKSIFVPEGAARGEVPAGDEKSRFTVELAATGDGTMLPYFIVVKCSVPQGVNPYDYRNMRVVQMLQKEPFFQDGWELKQWKGFKSKNRQKKGGKRAESIEEFEHFRHYLQHRDGHVVTCQNKAWMDTGGFAMYVDTVLGPWWKKQKDSWTGPEPVTHMLLVCDNASLHKAAEVQKKLDELGIILRFLPPNMTQWLQPLDLVVCGLIKTVQRARRARHLALDLTQWRDQQDIRMGQALRQGRRQPPLEPWLPPPPNLFQGIFFYHKTHHEELTHEKTKQAINRAFIDADILPFKPGAWKKYTQSSFMPKGSPAACSILHQVLKLQEKRAISACLLKCGMDDQDPQEWDDLDSLAQEGLDAEGLQSDEGEADRDKKEEDEMEEDVSSGKDHGENEDQGKGDEPFSRLVCVSPVLPSSDSDSDSLGGDDQEDEDVGGQAAGSDPTTSGRTSKRLRR